MGILRIFALRDVIEYMLHFWFNGVIQIRHEKHSIEPFDPTADLDQYANNTEFFPAEK